MVNKDLPNLHEPSTNTFHHFSPCCQPFLPVRFPLEQIARMECVRAQLKDTAQLTGRRCRPEPKLLHERYLLVGDERLKLCVEGIELGVVLDSVK